MEAFADVALFEIARAYLSSREQLIRRHQQAILEISTPVLQIRPGLLILPLIGMIDSQRARNLTDQLLLNIRARRAKIVVLDLTGVPAVDSAVANHLMQTVQAARLLGARGIVTGLSAENAQTLVRLGVNLGGLTTLGDLEDGIKLAERYLGYRLVLGETQGSTGVGEG
jgi:rsbT co-antagonist protein RsbR